MKAGTKKNIKLALLEILAISLFLFFLYPFALILINSAKDSFSVTENPTALPADWFRLFINLAAIMKSPAIKFPSSFLSSLLITGISLLFLNLVSSMAAWVLVRTNSRMSRFVFLMFVASMVIPFQIVMLPLLSWFRAIKEATGIPLLRSYTGIIFAYLGFGLSFSIFLFHGFIKGVPIEVEEAATIDGCSQIKTYWMIVMPLLKPIHATVFILNGIWIWNDFLLPLLVLGKGNAVQTLPLAVANYAGAYVKQWDLILTAILIAVIPVILFFFIAQRFIIKGVVAGSIK